MNSAVNPDSRLRVLVADAVAMSCRLLADALQRNPGYEASAALSAEETLHFLNRRRYDVVLVGSGFLQQPQGSFQLLHEIRSSRPGIGVVILLDKSQRELVVEAFRCGARGVFCRADSFQTLCKCIDCVHQGQVWANSAELGFVLDALLQPARVGSTQVPDWQPLSKRESEIARLVADGMSNRQVSQRLALSEHTVKNYLFRIFEKLGVSTRVELALYFLQRCGPRQGISHSGPTRVKTAALR